MRRSSGCSRVSTIGSFTSGSGCSSKFASTCSTFSGCSSPSAGCSTGLSSTFVFGFLWVLLVNLFMSQISGLSLHFAVNFAVALSLGGELASDWVKFGLIIFWIVLLVFTVWYYRFLRRRD